MRIRHTVIVALLACGFLSVGHAEENTVKEGAKEVGSAVGTATRTVGQETRQATKEIGQGTKKVTKEVGHAVRDATKETGHAFRDGAREFKKAVKGEAETEPAKSTDKKDPPKTGPGK